MVMEEVIRDEWTPCVGASWGAGTPERRGSRNGFSARDLATPSGPIEEVKGPRDRAGDFQTHLFDRS